MKATFRLSVLVFLLVLAVLPGALCGSGPAIAGAVGQLSVLDWPGYDAQAFWIDFKYKYPDVTVNFEIGSSDADIYGKIKAGSQADIIHPYTGWLQVYVDEGLVEEIDVTKLANWDKVPESFKTIGSFNGKQYFIPWDWGFRPFCIEATRSKGRSILGRRCSTHNTSVMSPCGTTGRRLWQSPLTFISTTNKISPPNSSLT